MSIKIDELTQTYKAKRLADFDIWNRIEQLAEYFIQNDLENAIVGISGGVDSAVVMRMLTLASSICSERGHHLNVRGYCYTFDRVIKNFQKAPVDALKKLYEHIEHINIEVIDLTDEYFMGGGDYEPSLAAQGAYAYRYHKLFCAAQQYRKSVVIGTTNLDEFAFSGWFGKHSDMMVDIQPIIDMHKFEVYEAAKHLSVPDFIIARKPAGDLIDNSTDEQNFGCRYDVLSWISYIMCRAKHDDFMIEWIKINYPILMDLHKKNAHKYMGQSFNPIMMVDDARFFYYNQR